MIPRHYLSLEDFAAIGVSLIIPVLIGFRFRGSGAIKSNDYFLAGKEAQMLPVVMSSAVSALSAITIMSIPAETYRFGIGKVQKTLILPIGQVIAAFVFIPVYFQCEVSSIYELLEKRFGKFTRYTVSALFIIQTLLYMCMVLLAPVLAMNAITGFSLEISIIIFGAVCTFYCVLGGLKAVLWTDLFQSVLMFACIFAMYAIGISEVGGVAEIIRKADAGQRLRMFDFKLDFSARYTFWNCFFRGLTYGAGYWGTNQIEVQRSLSLSSYKRAQKSLMWSTIPVVLLLLLSLLLGLVLHAVFYLCDPVKLTHETGISRYDQIVPYFIVSRLGFMPGLAGLCIAGIFSGSLSSMSSALNSLATVTVVDFAQPAFSKFLTDARALLLGKGLGVLYGALSIGLTFAFSKTDSVVQATNIFLSLSEGPILAIFLVAVLTRKGSDKSAVLSLLIGVCSVGWIGFGSMFGGFKNSPLPLETSGCTTFPNATLHVLGNETISYSLASHLDLAKNSAIFPFYKISFNWISPIGCFVTLTTLFIASLVLDGNQNVIPEDSKCLSPVTRYWIKDLPKGAQNRREININPNILNLEK